MRDNLPTMLRDAAKKWREKNKVVCVGELRYDFALEEAADAIEELMRRCEQFQYMPPPAWIPVTERLPEFEGAVLCMRKSNVYGVRPHQEILYVDEYGFKNYDDIYLADGVVTHWMPLPEPPKEE